jgi:hypothetical protein
MTSKIRLAAILILLPLSAWAGTVTLKPETVAAWDSYLAAAHAAMQARLQPGAHFLWLDEEPDRAEHVRRQGPYILPAGAHIPKKVPSGLIHDWLGAGFLPNVRIEDILRVVRNYDGYKDVYRPGVIGSMSHGTDGIRDRYFLRFANRSVAGKISLDTEGEASYFRVDDHRLYTVSNSLHIHEVDHFGTPEQRTLPEDTGTGLIWRLSSIARLEERDGGVYAELEAFALSRDIPAALRLFATPIVRRVSRDSLATSLGQTKVAIDAGTIQRAREHPAQ